MRFTPVIVYALAALGASAGVASAQGGTSGVDRLYVLDCGNAHAVDQSRWSPGVNVGVPIDISDNCYLIHHAKGYLLWDTGIPDKVAELADGLSMANGAMVWHRPKTVLAQLAEIGVKPSEVTYVAISHTHPDHVGNVEEFPGATVLIQKAEYDWAFASDKQPFAASHPVMKLEGDKDVFGDGSVTILSTPGHTPGHESLLVHLTKTGWLVLSGDAVHFQSNWDNRRIPGFNFDKEKTAASMQRIADIVAEHHGQLWINHDKPQSDKLRRPPQYYE
ncbi:MAG TPA: N-acyl homoserine lactonase family protein [Stellaceae bacterium]|nr:N-acyl homoserine lactonase family protein [Stellaceae bacterium]